MAIHETDGQFVISSGGMWLPGVYESHNTARYAFRIPEETLEKLQRSLDHLPPAKRVITMTMLRAARREANRASR